MTTGKTCVGVLGAAAVLFGAGLVHAQDWPQWRGPNRDAKATGFTAPKTWPKELAQKWKVKVGDGVATPALVGDKLFVFAREGNDEILRCLDAGTGKELWAEKDAQNFQGQGDRGYPGPRSSPTVADGKVVTLGVNGNLSCHDAASGKKLWSKEDFKGSYPMFHTSSSPIVEGGLCVAQLGGQRNGTIVAYELADGKEKWKWPGEGTAYASPALLIVDGLKVVMAETDKSVVALNLSDGKLLWQTPYPIPMTAGGGGRPYNASSPMVEGQTLILTGSGRGAKAFKITKEGDAVTGKELWSNTDNSTQFNTPVQAKGHLFGLSNSDKLFCVNAETGKTAWASALGAGGGRGQAGYGSIVDAGPVLMALTPATDLVVFEPDAKELKQVAKYKVGDSRTYAYPVVSGNRIFVKDNDSVILWTIE